MRPIGTAPELELRRRRAVDLVKQGESPDDGAHFLGVGRSSVSTWLKLDRESPDRLAVKPHPGPMPRLTGEQLRGVEGRANASNLQIFDWQEFTNSVISYTKL